MLSNANTGVGTWEPGWEISKIEKNGKLVVKKNGLKIWILPYQFVPLNSNRIEVGKKGYLLMVKEFRELLSGFYMANGNMIYGRKYFNCKNLLEYAFRWCNCSYEKFNN